MSNAAAGALLAETRRRPGRVLLTGLAVTVATVFAAGTLLFSDTLGAYLASKVVRTPAAAAVVVEPRGRPAADLVRTAGRVDGVAGAVEVRSAYLPGNGGGSAWYLSSDPMRGPLSRLAAPVSGRLPTGPGEVVVGTTTAERNGARPGRAVTVAERDGSARTFTVTGVVRMPAESLNTVVAIPDAVAALGGSLEQVDLLAAPGVDATALAARVGAAVGPDTTVRTGEQQRATERDTASASVSAVLVGIGVFAGLALVAAAVVVASTFRIVLTQRRSQLALLRCVGARRGQLIGAVLAEGP